MTNIDLAYGGLALDIAQISTQFFTAAMPAVSVSAGIVGFLLIISGCILRWHSMYSFFKRFFLRQRQYDYHTIFSEYLDRFNSITDRRELYPAILSVACKILNAEGASLLVRDTKDHFQMKASFGLKPFSFSVEEAKPFLEWLGRYRNIVTRRDIVSSKSCWDIKNEALCYFVQFDAEACVPLFISDKLYGVINLGLRECGDYDSETRNLLRLMAVQFATAIHNANLYQALIQQNQKLLETSHFKTQLLSNVSHELRTPLAGIIGLSEMLQEGTDGDLTDDQRRHVKLIRQSGLRLLDTVTAMVDISRLEANRLELNVQKLNVAKLVQDVANDVKLMGSTKLEVKFEEDSPGAYGDERRVRQILKHLMDNAAKFTKKGKITVSAEKCGEMLKVIVGDTGIGISRDKQKTVFDGFNQGDGSKTREFEGLGLGLAISKKLVELHGGRLWLTSKEGRGSEFFFTLPLKPVGVYGNGRVAA